MFVTVWGGRQESEAYFFFYYGLKMICSTPAKLNRQNESFDRWWRCEVWEAKREDKGRSDTFGAPRTLTCTDEMAPEAFGADGEKHLADRTERAPLFYKERRHFAF